MSKTRLLYCQRVATSQTVIGNVWIYITTSSSLFRHTAIYLNLAFKNFLKGISLSSQSFLYIFLSRISSQVNII
ncbi:MAG: hypothetical protein JZD40_01085, partial [Sulfolobus sp.]|nr:hypothetical protein [Sulfolobus sp.]